MARSFGSAVQDARGNWWANSVDADGNTTYVPVTGPQSTWDEGNTVYNRMTAPDGGDGGFSQNYLPSDWWRWQSGTELSPQEFQQFYQTLASPRVSNDFGSLSPEQYLSDPRALIRQEGGKYIYRPEMQQGDFNPIPQDHSFGGLVRGFLSSPGIALMSTGIGAGNALNALSTGGWTGLAEHLNPLNKLSQLGEGVQNLFSGAGDLAGLSDEELAQYLEGSIRGVGGEGGAVGPQGYLNPESLDWTNAEGGLNNWLSDVGGETSWTDPASSVGWENQFDLGNVGKAAGGTSALTKIGGPGAALASMLKSFGIEVSPSDLKDWATIGAGVGGAILGNKDKNENQAVAREQIGTGKAYNDQALALLADPNYTNAEVDAAFNEEAKRLGRSWSAKVGNPALSPQAINESTYGLATARLNQRNARLNQLLQAAGLGQAGYGNYINATNAGSANMQSGLGAVLGGLTGGNTSGIEQSLKTIEDYIRNNPWTTGAGGSSMGPFGTNKP